MKYPEALVEKVFQDLKLIYLVVCEISHQPILNVGVVGDTTQDLGTLEGSLWVGAAVVQIPARDRHRSPSYTHSEQTGFLKSFS